ncbi:MAG: hypothetical protein QF535_22960, partial [Anaerolineales bacterium]|nr:hypothetical protein [Anaerolineales bacterium]
YRAAPQAIIRAVGTRWIHEVITIFIGGIRAPSVRFSFTRVGNNIQVCLHNIKTLAFCAVGGTDSAPFTRKRTRRADRMCWVCAILVESFWAAGYARICCSVEEYYGGVGNRRAFCTFYGRCTTPQAIIITGSTYRISRSTCISKVCSRASSSASIIQTIPIESISIRSLRGTAF